METTELLAKAISRIDPSGSMFTSTHFMLAKFAFDNDSAEPALPIINRPVTAFPDMDGPKETAPLSSQDIPPSSFISKTTGLTQDVTTAMVLEYYHYCARIYISRREWQNALKSLERIITHPTKDRLISKLMLDGYRKWTLVGLLCNGCKPTMPSCVSGPTKNLFSTLAPRYGSLAGLYGSDDAITIKEDIEKNMASWREDGNEALINEVLIEYQPWPQLATCVPASARFPGARRNDQSGNRQAIRVSRRGHIAGPEHDRLRDAKRRNKTRSRCGEYFYPLCRYRGITNGGRICARSCSILPIRRTSRKRLPDNK